MRGAHSVKVFRYSPGYFHQAPRDTYDVAQVDSQYAVIYQTSFADVGQELLLQAEQKGRNGEEVDMYKICNRVKPDPELATLIEKYRLDESYVLKNVVIDNVNEENPC